MANITIACTHPPEPIPASQASIEPEPAAAVVASSAAAAPVWQAAKRVLDGRCAVCHGCYDAPCQLVLSSFEGVARGASKIEVYDGARLRAIEPTRLFIDEHSVLGWRQKGFHAVLPEGNGREVEAREQNEDASLLLRMLALKRTHPLQIGAPLGEDFDLGLDRDQQCPEPSEWSEFAEEHPRWGMPYALPGLNDSDHEALVSWVEAGAPTPAPFEPDPQTSAAIRRWEDFFNGASLKERLMARYIYEHLFLASLYFAEADGASYFRLVRSRTPPGQPIEEIATRRPFDDPGTFPFYYRLRPQQTTILVKTHLPYALSERRMARYRELFLSPDYEVRSLPSYDPASSANPFAAFHALPVRSRYRFMLDEAEFTMMGFIKGPVCRGQVALDVIEDRFWVTFVNPELPLLEAESAFLAGVSEDLALPAEQGSNGYLVTWLKYARRERQYLRAKSAFLSRAAKTREQVSLEALWNGDGHNPNAALTVFRHYDSATVIKGFAGGPPKTAWVVGYALLERIHYLLVAGFDVFGNLGHQLNTRMYMDFLRMEGEHNLLALLPTRRRRPLVDAWYRDVDGAVKDQIYGKVARFEQETSIPFRTNKPELELYPMLEARMRAVLERGHALEPLPAGPTREALERIASVSGLAASQLPEASFVEVESATGNNFAYFTILRDSAHTNVAQLFREDARRVPDEDRLSVLRGFVGAYPNALFRVAARELEDFARAIQALQGADGYARLRARFGMSRTDPTFWQVSDRMHAAFRQLSPREAGLFDFNRLDP